MATEFSFGFDPQFSQVETEFELTVACELTMLNKEEWDVSFRVFKSENDEEVKFDSLDIRDRAMISGKVWNPPDNKIQEATEAYLEPQYDKYANF